MVNHFRSLLLNLADVGTAEEHICPGFGARNLNGRLLAFYQVLFPVTTTRARKIELAQAYLELIESASLGEAITAVDTRLTYDLKTTWNNFKKTSFDLDTLLTQLNNGIPEGVLSQDKGKASDKYDNIWRSHPNKAYRLAGLIVAYVNRLT